MAARRTAVGALRRVLSHFRRYSWTVPVWKTKRHGEARIITGSRLWYWASNKWQRTYPFSSPTVLVVHTGTRYWKHR